MTDTQPVVAPALNGQILGQTEKATRALLDRLLAETATTFEQWVALRFVALSDSPPTRDALVAQMTFGLKVDDATALATLGELTALGLATVEAAAVALTTDGAARFEAINRGATRIAARLYGDLPPADLETAARVLTIVTERANAALAGAGAA